MKTSTCLFGLRLATSLVSAGGLPVVTTPPQDQIVPPGSNAVFSVNADGATGFQWRFGGNDIPGATNSTLIVTNIQYTNSGYYSVVAKNATGWVPSLMAYLSVVSNSGALNFDNCCSSATRAYSKGVFCDGFDNYGLPITNGNAQLLAGPAPDKIEPIGNPVEVLKGFFSGGFRYVPTGEPGATTYCRVDITFPNCQYSNYFQPSATIEFVLGPFPTMPPSPPPSLTNIVFPYFLEWPDPLFGYLADQTKLPGETATFTLFFTSWLYNFKRVQWRKDGSDIVGATNVGGWYGDFNRVTTLTVTNLQAGDAGVYDVVVSTTHGPAVSSKSRLSIQLANGGGTFRNPRVNTGYFLSDLEGMPGRNYAIQWSTNLSDWSGLTTLSNITGTVTFTNNLSTEAWKYYRAALLP